MTLGQCQQPRVMNIIQNGFENGNTLPKINTLKKWNFPEHLFLTDLSCSFLVSIIQYGSLCVQVVTNKPLPVVIPPVVTVDSHSY